MSGSSLDGVDLALVRFHLESKSIDKWEMLATGSISFPPALREALATTDESQHEALAMVDRQLGSYFGQVCHEFSNNAGVKPDYIASHGHTIAHHPDKGYTLQIGNPEEIARHAGCPVISDFRSADIAAGGQGAPLAPVAEHYLFPGHRFYLNLGGIANLSDHGADSIRAWDICPCNQLLNHVANSVGKSMDEDGRMARKGVVDDKLLHNLLEKANLPHHGPFSLDNKHVRNTYIDFINTSPADPADKLRTATEFIAESVFTQAQNQIKFNKNQDSMFITGGGAHNIFLAEKLGQKLDSLEIRVIIPDNDIIDFKEAALMALCGALRINGIPNSFASVTGATHDTVNGEITRAE